MLRAAYIPYTLKFRTPGGTSRGVLTEKKSWFIRVWDERNPEVYGLGECGLLAGLSFDDQPEYEQQLRKVCRNIQRYQETLHGELAAWPSIRFGLEMALRDLQTGGERFWFNTPFTRGEEPIIINGLVWMGRADEMAQRISQKIEEGFRCIKMKIGAIDFDQELLLLSEIRSHFSAREMEIRVDANGAFDSGEAHEKINQLAEFELHSIEQPIQAGQWKEMSRLCADTPLPIALDEELIGVWEKDRQLEMLQTIQPQYIILKPSLVGGFRASERWIHLAEGVDAGWWVTSALESNVGLAAIAQWTSTLGSLMPQGLGTGQLYTNNFPAPLQIREGKLHHTTQAWQLQALFDARWNN
ncbi:MAG: o-succinylbenzoate synthase [Cryomorphaceae bacterium]|nr:MAG: o-succinylbenzoate synthase [Cryomorphaceae bacterium]